jgi:hypothetical protein
MSPVRPVPILKKLDSFCRGAASAKAVVMLLLGGGCSTLNYDIRVDRDPNMGKYSIGAPAHG